MAFPRPDSTPTVRELHAAIAPWADTVDTKLAALASELAAIKALLTPTTPPPTTPQPTGAPGSWNLVWRDEFDGTAIDPAKWRSCYPWDCHSGGNGERMVYTPANVEVSNGSVKLRASYEPAGISDAGFTSSYASAMIQTREKSWPAAPPLFTVQYGFIEARLRVPRFPSMFPAFWLLGESDEIDVMEVFGDVNEYSCGFHLNKYSGGQSGGKITEIGEQISDDADIFGCNWTPTAIEFYFNGQMIKRLTGEMPNEPMGIFLNLAIGANFIPQPLPTATQLATRPALEVEYVRVWKPA